MEAVLDNQGEAGPAIASLELDDNEAKGILSDDRGLAAALWRTFFNQKCEDPRQLELLVEYVRKQIQYLDSMNGEDLLLTGEVSWRPLVEKNPQSILKPHSPTYNDEGL
ncbi:hypothetical protein CB1_001108025 [Camelus ferus]|nr:hypothetical protein CB1_001108025 [Camelus ferus]